jgi:hypothetical protein
MIKKIIKMKNLILFLLAIFIIGCNGIDRKFSFVSNEDFHWLYGDTLELFQEDDKCGEWGGDIATIKIYHKREGFGFIKLFGYYIKKSFNCDSLELLPKAVPIIHKSKEIEFSKQQIELLKKAIIDLTEYKLKNLSIVGHSGIVNIVQVKGNDGSFEKNYMKLYISDYPSFKWNKFHKLKTEILK